MMGLISTEMKGSHNHIPRKIYHLVSASIIPTIYLLEIFDRDLIIVSVSIVTALWLGFDFARIYVRPINELFSRSFSFLMKEKEVDQLTGMSYVLIGSTIALLLFPPMVAVASLYFMSIGDPAASIIGKAIGRFKVSGGRTAEGSAAMFMVCLLVAFSLDLNFRAVFGAFAAVLTELFSGAIDDNLTVPVISGVVMIILGVN
ncbi:hypothetical protein MNBD_NITROSPINAE02-583 [hydrothermal vent metagenome]|uniref:Phosphatidate cytidylyltransferase n=1 Tax=hydrothermal vent metagenome TaxID=652676 RepID=A0A3B1CLN4_9ZZZZ